jgi:ABC-type phosphate transport system substrate-binding protein
MEKFMQGFIRACSFVVALGGAGVAQAVDITGAGATFPYPIYSKWAEIYKAKTGSASTISPSALAVASSRSSRRPLISARPTCP